MKRFLVGVVLLLVFGRLYAHSIIVDGDPIDWIGATVAENDTYYVDAGEFIWLDTQGDDVGDGGDALNAQDNPSGYTYPLDTSYTGGEADIIQFRLTADTQNLYFLIQLDTFTSIYNPLVVVTIDVDHLWGSGEIWIPQAADLVVDSLISWEYAIVLGDGSIRVFNSTWNDITDSVQAQVVFNTNGGYVEASLNALLLEPSGNILDSTIYLTCVAGINEFGNFKEVDSIATQWYGGGGLGESGNTDAPYWIEPDVYDLAFVSSEDQINDLNTYDENNATPAIIRNTSAIAATLSLVVKINEKYPMGDKSLPVLFAKGGRLVFDSNVESVVIYSRTGAKIGEYKSPVISLPLSMGAYLALVKDNKGQRLYRIINAK